MTEEIDFDMVKRAYAEMARRAREKDEVRRPPRTAVPAEASDSVDSEPGDHDTSPA